MSLLASRPPVRPDPAIATVGIVGGPHKLGPGRAARRRMTLSYSAPWRRKNHVVHAQTAKPNLESMRAAGGVGGGGGAGWGVEVVGGWGGGGGGGGERHHATLAPPADAVPAVRTFAARGFALFDSSGQALLDARRRARLWSCPRAWQSDIAPRFHSRLDAARPMHKPPASFNDQVAERLADRGSWRTPPGPASITSIW